MARNSRVVTSRLEKSDIETKNAFVHGFPDSDPEIPNLIDSVIRQYVTPYAPPPEILKGWWWAAIAGQTTRVFAVAEDKMYNALEAFFQKHSGTFTVASMNERIRGWCCRIKQAARLRQQVKAAADAVAKNEAVIELDGAQLGGTHSDASAELRTVESELMKDDAIFLPFDELASVVVDYVIAYNVRRNVFRDLAEADQLQLVWMLYPPVPNTEAYNPEVDRAKIDKLFSPSWASRLIPLIEDASAATVDGALKPNVAWLECRLKKYREMHKWPQMHEDRKLRVPKTQMASGTSAETKKEEPSSSVIAARNRKGETSGVVSTTNKRKRATEGTTSLTVKPTTAGGEEINPPPNKRKRVSSQHTSAQNTPVMAAQSLTSAGASTIVGSLVQRHDLTRILSLIQSCPFVLPLPIKCRIAVPGTATLSVESEGVANSVGKSSKSPTTKQSGIGSPHPTSATQSLTTHHQVELEWALHSMDNWERQDVTLTSKGVKGMNDNARFCSVSEALRAAEAALGGTAIVEAAINLPEEKLRPWQVFQVSTAPAMFPFSGKGHGGLDPPSDPDFKWREGMAILDLLAIHYWIQKHSIPRNAKGDNWLILNLVLASGTELIGRVGPCRRIQLPAHITSGIMQSRMDYAPRCKSTGDIELDRVRAGQLQTLSRINQYLCNFYRHSLRLPSVLRRASGFVQAAGVSHSEPQTN